MVALSIALPLTDLRERSSVETLAPIVVTVGSRENDSVTAVNIGFQLEEGPQVLNHANGVVTAVPLSAGQAISQGLTLVEINYRPVVAFQAASPLYRDLGFGDRGRDVELLANFLVQIGLLDANDLSSTFSSKIRTAVKRFQAKIGAATDGRFLLDYVAYVPTGMATAGEVNMSVGDQAAAGASITKGVDTPIGVTITATNEARVLSLLAGVPLKLRLAEQEVELSGLIPTAEELPALYVAVSQSVHLGTVTLMDANDSLNPRYSGGILAKAVADIAGTVPSSAVRISDDGEQCVFIPSGDSSFDIIRLADTQIASSEIGVLFVDSGLVGKAVIRNPDVLPADIIQQC